MARNLDPLKCEICRGRLIDRYIDGATKRGSWAAMCTACFIVNGRGLGAGAGQLFQRSATGEWIKIKG